MGKQEKLREKLLSKPKDFKWSELVSCLEHLGFELLNGKGSRRKFFHKGMRRVVTIHEPHPQSILKSYQIESVINTLKEMELI